MFQERTLLDLLVEYHLDVFENKPIEAHRQADGEIQFTDTGDPLIDKWEQQLAEGTTPNLLESFNPEAIEKLKKLKNSSSKRTMTMKEASEIAEKDSKKYEREVPPDLFKTFGGSKVR